MKLRFPWTPRPRCEAVAPNALPRERCRLDGDNHRLHQGDKGTWWIASPKGKA